MSSLFNCLFQSQKYHPLDNVLSKKDDDLLNSRIDQLYSTCQFYQKISNFDKKNIDIVVEIIFSKLNCLQLNEGNLDSIIKNLQTVACQHHDCRGALARKVAAWFNKTYPKYRNDSESNDPDAKLWYELYTKIFWTTTPRQY